jgi:hypothetical protein
MTTADYIDWIIEQTQYQNTPTQMLKLVNIAQNEIFQYNTYFNQVKPERTSLLATQSTIQQYTMSTSLNIREVARVYIYDSYGNKQDVAVESTIAMDNEDPVVIDFAKDPGDTTDKFYYEAYTWPTYGQLASTSISLSVPESIQTGYLRYIVTRMLEEGKDGRSIYNIDEEEAQKKNWLRFANAGASLESNTPIPSVG